MADHGSRTRYTRGCRCDRCKCAEANYRRNKRARDRGEDISVPETETGLGSVESAIRSELASYSGSALRPGLCELLVAMSRVIDDPRARAQHASVARQIQLGLERIRSQSVTKRMSNLYGKVD